MAAVTLTCAVYCGEYSCSHSLAIRADHWSDGLKLADIEQQFVCRACGKRGGEASPQLEIRMDRRIAVALYVVVMVTVIVGVDLAFFRNRFWERLAANIGLVLLFGAFYFRFLSP